MNTTSFISGAGFDRSNVASQPLLQGQLHVLVQFAAYLLEVVIITSHRSTIVLLRLQALSSKIGEFMLNPGKICVMRNNRPPHLHSSLRWRLIRRPPQSLLNPAQRTQLRCQTPSEAHLQLNFWAVLLLWATQYRISHGSEQVGCPQLWNWIKMCLKIVVLAFVQLAHTGLFLLTLCKHTDGFCISLVCRLRLTCSTRYRLSS